MLSELVRRAGSSTGGVTPRWLLKAPKLTTAPSGKSTGMRWPMRSSACDAASDGATYRAKNSRIAVGFVAARQRDIVHRHRHGCLATLAYPAPLPAPSPCMTTSHRTDLGGLDFEPTDFEDARRALDELPAGVTTAKTLEPGYWDRQRRPTLPSDRALSGQTIQWLLALPLEMRPKALVDQFPRIANRLADAWPRPVELEALLQELLIDRRGRRRGFPPEVAAELEALCAHVAGRP
jgi:hypothetical protein